jgi:hypothetical protein
MKRWQILQEKHLFFMNGSRVICWSVHLSRQGEGIDSRQQRLPAMVYRQNYLWRARSHSQKTWKQLRCGLYPILLPIVPCRLGPPLPTGHLLGGIWKLNTSGIDPARTLTIEYTLELLFWSGVWPSSPRLKEKPALFPAQFWRLIFL